MTYPQDDDFEMNFFAREPEPEATMMDLKTTRHAVFDWAAGGATDLIDDAPTTEVDLDAAQAPVEEAPAPEMEFRAAEPEPDEQATVELPSLHSQYQPQPQPETSWEPAPAAVPQPAPAQEPLPAQQPPVSGRESNGHVVLVSGGDRGIGAAAVRRFWNEGYRTAFFYHTNEDAARALVNELGSDCVAVRCDVSDRAACEAAWKVVQRTVGDPDVLVCNAGIAQQKLFTDITEADWQQMIGVDLTGVFHLCQLALPAMIRNKYGRILTVSSMWGQTGGSCEVHYSAAKAGVIGLTKALAKEEGPSGITVNCVAPGVIETDMMSSFTPEDKAALAEETPVQRLGSPEEVARTLVFLADEQSGFITGQICGVNGGLVI